jgi:hypothetical protein
MARMDPVVALSLNWPLVLSPPRTVHSPHTMQSDANADRALLWLPRLNKNDLYLEIRIVDAGEEGASDVLDMHYEDASEELSV